MAFAAACGTQSTTPEGAADPGQLPADQVIYDVQHNMTRDGVRTGALVADSAYLHEASRRMHLNGVELRFFNDNGMQSGVLTSETGEYEMSTGSFVARGDVVLITEGPEGRRRLETEELHYDVPNDRLWSDVPFVLREDDGVTRGTSFRSDAEFRNWTVTGAQTEGGIRSGGAAGPGGQGRPTRGSVDAGSVMQGVEGDQVPSRPAKDQQPEEIIRPLEEAAADTILPGGSQEPAL